MRGLINLGMLYNEMEHPDEALIYLEKAMQQARLAGEEIEIGKIYINIGTAYRLKGEFNQAETYIRLAEAIFRRFSNILELANVGENLGAIYLDQHKLTEAKLYLEANLKIWRSLDNKYGEIQTMLHLIRYELLQENLEAASDWLQEVEHQLRQHDQAKRYHQLYRQVNEFRRSLTKQV
jgi:tetratricopeptide (TPR) repeat protein